MKSTGTAYLLWLVSGFGWLGFHYFYLGKHGKAIIWIFTLGIFGIGSLVDLFTLGSQVKQYNTDRELDTIRTNALAQESGNTAERSSPGHRSSDQDISDEEKVRGFDEKFGHHFNDKGKS